MTESVLLCIIICFTIICVISITTKAMANEQKVNKETSVDMMFYKLHDIALKQGATEDELKQLQYIYWRYIASYKEGDDKC